jgi:hypothetical protein
MNQLAKLASWIGLAATAAPCLLFYFNAIDLNAMKTITLIGTLVWFIATPIWMGRESDPAATEVEI